MRKRSVKNANGIIYRKDEYAKTMIKYILEHNEYAETNIAYHEFLKHLDDPVLKSIQTNAAFNIENIDHLIKQSQLDDVLNKLYKLYPDIGRFEDTLVKVSCKPIEYKDGKLMLYPLNGYIADEDRYDAQHVVYIINFKLNNEWYVYKIGMTDQKFCQRINCYFTHGNLNAINQYTTDLQFIQFLNAFYNTPGFDCKIMVAELATKTVVNEEDALFNINKIVGYNAHEVENKLIKALYKTAGYYPIGCFAESANYSN